MARSIVFKSVWPSTRAAPRAILELSHYVGEIDNEACLLWFLDRQKIDYMCFYTHLGGRFEIVDV